MAVKSRLGEILLDDMTPLQREAHDRIAAGPRGEVVGPLRVWVNNPGLADRAQALGQYARYDSSLPPILSELAILITARIWSSGFEWAQHAPIALSEGLAGHIVSAIALGHRPEILDPKQLAVFQFAVELHRDRQISDEAYQAALKYLGQEAVIDLVGVCGYYTLISMTINAFDLPDGTGPVLPSIDVPTEQLFC